MRNFTLGTKGMPIFLFALLFFSGTYLYGQNCPTVVDEDGGTGGNQQTFCYLQTVADLQATANGDGIVWYRTATSTNPIPSNELLEDGVTYYAGNQSGTCTSREAVEVTVNNLGAPTPSFGAFFQPCEYGTNDVSTVQDLIDIVDADDPNYTIEVYTEEFSGTVLDPSTELVAGTSYFVGQRDTSGNDCPSTRVAIQYLPILSIAPTGDADQQFCTGATVADLQAQATTDSAQAFRWYSTATSNPALDPSTPLVDGETYYASQITNRTNSSLPPCESTDRFAVNVTLLTGDAGNPNTAIVCETDVQETFPSIDAIRNFYLALLDEGVSQTGTFSPTPEQLAQQYQNDADGLGDFSTTYTLGADECSASVVLTASIIAAEPANAGDDVSLEFSVGDGVQNLTDFITAGAQTTGKFEGYPQAEFDPQAEGPGTYTINYTVDETSGCITGSDTAVFTITVNPCDANAGADVDTALCRSEAEALAAQFLAASSDAERNAILASFLGDRDTDGTFTGDPAGEIASKYNAGVYPFTVSTTYVVGSGICEDDANIVLTVYEDANAGDDATITLNPDDAPVNLFDLLGANAEPGGTWNMGDGTFDPATDTAGTYTYTVGEGCTDSANVVVTVNTTPVEPDPTSGYTIVCEADVQTLFPSVDEIRKFYLRLLPTGVATNGTFNPTPAQLADIYQADEDGLGEFSTVYTVNGESYDLTVNIVTEAEAGSDATVTLASDDAPINLFDYLGENALQGGTWSTGDGTFDPATDEAGSFTYTVGYETCTDSATVTVVISDEPTDPCEGVVDAGTDSSATVCETDVQTLFPSIDEIRKYYLSLLDAGVDRTGTLNPSASQLATIYQNDEDGLGEFTTTYTLTSGECSDSVQLTVNIVPVEPANAGTINDFEVCTNENLLDLNQYLGDDSSKGGSFFDADGNEIADGLLDVSSVGVLEITYTVSEDNADACVTGSDSTDFTVTVGENTANAGADNSVIVCNSEVKTLSTTGVKNLYLGLLEDGVATNGTFNPTIQELIDQYNLKSNFGDFTTTYTVGTGNCTDSAELTVTVLENPDAGQSTTVNLEEGTTDTVDLFAELGGTPETGGTWTFGGNEVDGTFDPATDDEGAYTYTVTNDNGCSASAVVTIVIGEPVECPDVTETAQTFCTGATVASLMPQDATWYASADATEALAADSALTDGGEYFAGDAAGECTAREMVTVTLVDAPIAPTVEDFTACASDNSTVADLIITGDANAVFTVYSDDTLETPVTDTDVLVDGTYYVTQTSTGGCESDAAELEVTLNDSDAPTLAQDGNIFCEFDNATLADVEENMNANGDITWYASATGDETYSKAEVLENGVTYYASSTPEGECESFNRLAVTITLETCEVLIPEAFSPNGDNVNDKFVVLNISSEYPNHKMEIYNRWGEPVFIGQVGEQQGWDGTSTEGSFGSGVLPAGVYFYILYYNDGTTSPTQGRVYLSR